VDVWKENVLEDLKSGEIEFELVGEFLLELKKEFGEGDEKSVKVAELKNVEQKGRIMKEFVQEFRRRAKRSEYEERASVEEFKGEMNRMIRRKLIEVKRSPTSIKQ